MELFTKLHYARSTKNTHVYKEGSDTLPITKSIYIERHALPEPPPTIEVRIVEKE